MKKIFTVILLVLILMLTSCGEQPQENEVVSSTESSSSQSESKEESVVSSVIPEVNDYMEHTYNVTEIMEYLKLDGRYAKTETSVFAGKQKCISFDNTAQLLAFNADCEGDVTLNMSIKVGADKKRASHYFLIYVDGVEQERAVLDGKPGFDSEQKLVIAKGLEKGEHSFKVYRQSELLHGMENIISITMNGVPTERPANSKHYIEFFGDSITAGYGNLTQVKDNDDPMQPLKSDGTKAYAFLTAQKLGMDCSIVARSGLAYSYDPIFDYWNYASFSRNWLGKYEEKRQPDVVVIAFGTNDHDNYKSKGLTLDDLENKAVELLTQVRKERPKAKIIWAYGMGETRIKEQLTNALNRMGGENKGFYFFGSPTYYGGGGWHHKAEEHEKIAESLSAFIKELL